MPIKRSLLSAVLLGAAAYLVWSRTGRRAPDPLPAETAGMRSVGEDRGQGNLLGIQPWLEAGDYASPGRLLARLHGYFQAAAAGGVLNEKTVVVLPEHLGTWLAASGEKTGVYRAKTVQDAVGLIVAGNLPAFLRRLPHAREEQWAMATVLRMKAAEMAAGYHQVMSTLARRHHVHLVAGSLILPEPSLCDGVLRAGRGRLYNTVVFYTPDGRAVGPPVRKAFPTEEELPLLGAGCPGALPVFSTPAGRLGILICADSWYPSCYAALKSQGVDLVAVPSFDPLLDIAGCWRGYSGAPAPPDVDPADVGRLHYADAWQKYALATRITLAGARAGMNIYYRGALWDMRLTGRPTLIAGDRVTEFAHGEQAALVNLWL